MEFVGIDLHTNRFTCCYLDHEGEKGMVKEVIVANSFKLKTISLADKKTDKVDSHAALRRLML